MSNDLDDDHDRAIFFNHSVDRANANLHINVDRMMKRLGIAPVSI